MFKEIDIKDMKFNPFTLLNDEWGLLSAGNEDSFNTMTISWGFVGVMWHKNVVAVVVRPQRYTKEFIDKFDKFTLSFFEPDKKEALTILGRKSGRDCDKVKESGLTPHFLHSSVGFKEAKMTFVCKKLFGNQQIDFEKFIDKTIVPSLYPNNDFHFIYIGEIEKVLQK